MPMIKYSKQKGTRYYDLLVFSIFTEPTSNVVGSVPVLLYHFKLIVDIITWAVYP